jgi:hypothetical protein
MILVLSDRGLHFLVDERGLVPVSGLEASTLLSFVRLLLYTAASASKPGRRRTSRFQLAITWLTPVASGANVSPLARNFFLQLQPEMSQAEINPCVTPFIKAIKTIYMLIRMHNT